MPEQCCADSTLVITGHSSEHSSMVAIGSKRAACVQRDSKGSSSGAVAHNTKNNTASSSSSSCT
eukprot:14393-Heterococcus_DN1.PRE.2